MKYLFRIYFSPQNNFSIKNKLEKFSLKKPQIEEIQQKVPFYPKQHPKKIHLENTQIMSHNPKIKFLSPLKEVPYHLHINQDLQQEFESPQNSVKLQVCILGAPNAGKSSLLNAILNKNVSAVSNKAHTTDDKVVGILTNSMKNSQITFVDTPGISRTSSSSKHYVSRAWECLADSDKAILLVDGVKRLDDSVKVAIKRLNKLKIEEVERKKINSLANPDTFDDAFQKFHQKNQIKQYDENVIPKILVINKIDLQNNKKKLKELVMELEDLARFDKTFYISCITGYGIDKLCEYLESECYKDQWEYPAVVTSPLGNEKIQFEADSEQIEQIIKSQVFQRFYHEIPFQTGINLTEQLSQLLICYLLSSDIYLEYVKRSDGKVKIEFTLDVATKIQMQILIGNKGRNISVLQNQIRLELIKHFQYDFIIEIKVKLRVEKSVDKANNREEHIVPDNITKKLIEEIKQFQKQDPTMVPKIIKNAHSN